MVYPANAFAHLMFFTWPVVAIVLFATLRRSLAVSITIIGGILLLPERLELQLPGVPPIDKHGLVTICAMFGVVATNARLFGLLAPSSFWRFAVMAMNSVVTVLMNPDPMRFGYVIVPALDFSAIRAYLLADLMGLAFPVWVGEAVFRNLDDLRDLLKTLVVGAILYIPLILIELRLSPQLHTWIYGFFPHEFSQAARAGGFRSNVFLVHGLVLSKMLEECVVAALILRMQRQRIFGIKAGTWGVVLFVVLVLNKSVAAIIYALFCVAVLIWTSPKVQMKISVVLLAIVFVYPVMRVEGWFPTDFLVSLSTNEQQKNTADDRGQSLAFRFANEEVLLAHMLERPWFGWGGHGRNNTYDAQGHMVTVTDGQWIIELGVRGAVGTLVWFTLIAAPILTARRRLFRGRSPPEVAVLSACVLLLATSWADLLPNSGPSAYILLLVGATLGVLRAAPQPVFSGLVPMPRGLPLQQMARR
jgi:hypothetical protein